MQLQEESSATKMETNSMECISLAQEIESYYEMSLSSSAENVSPSPPRKHGNGKNKYIAFQSFETDQKGEQEGESKDPNLGKEHYKTKRKVGWTPELHKKFVQAVNKLGMENAIPTQILRLMNVEGLTRYNVASHLQRYRKQKGYDVEFRRQMNLENLLCAPTNAPSHGRYSICHPLCSPQSDSPFHHHLLPDRPCSCCTNSMMEAIEELIKDLQDEPPATMPLGLKLSIHEIILDEHTSLREKP